MRAVACQYDPKGECVWDENLKKARHVLNTKDVLSLMLQTALLVVTLIGVIIAIVSLVA